MLARLSDIIEEFLKQSMREMDGIIEIQRNELAVQFNCVPSQINYVIDTRFTSERGYMVESRRGGGGSIRIRRVDMKRPSSYLMHAINSLGTGISQQAADSFIRNFTDYDIIHEDQAILMKAAMSDKALGIAENPERDMIRARILKNMLMSLVVMQ